jgi:glycosyltransferase involved in cell wall biosynthesis
MKLSVAMITYNHERYIREAIESVLAQEVNFEYEIVIGEDCSTDGTRAIITDFQRRYPGRIKLLVRERNIGGLRNLESTLTACSGQYLAILEGDDYWTRTDKLQRQTDFLDAHPDCAICCSRVLVFDETGSVKSGVGPTLAAGPYTIEDVLRVNFIVTCSVVGRRDVIAPLPPSLSQTKIGDFPRCVLAARYGKIELMDEVMAAYRLHPRGTWSSMNKAARAQEVARALRALDKELGYEYAETIRQTIAGWYCEAALEAQSNGQRIETARHLFTCIRNGGLQPGGRRLLAGLAAYALIGKWYKVFSRANAARGTQAS